MSGLDELLKSLEKVFKNVTFDNDKGTIRVGDSRFVLFFSDSLVSIQKRMESLVGFDSAGMLLYEAYKEAGRNRGLAIGKTMKMEKTRSVKTILTVLEMMRSAAWGRWELREFDHLKSVFIVSDSPIAEIYGKSNRAVCHPIRGLIGGFAEFFTGEKRECVEVLCKAKGDDHCEFIVATPENITKMALERTGKT